jgi:uncharacterized protein YprB with RNaseH-like and TPR domain
MSKYNAFLPICWLLYQMLTLSLLMAIRTIVPMDPELRARLRRLGVVKGARELDRTRTPKRVNSKQQSTADDHGQPADRAAAMPITSLLPGIRLEETELGQCLVLDKVFEPSHRHGQDGLGDILGQGLTTLVGYTGGEELSGLFSRDVLFLDTETTGLSGAGTLAFMVGVAFFERGPRGDTLVVRQYFLRDHGDEAAMLWMLEELAQTKQVLATFNGRSFDLPLLLGRYFMNQMATSLPEVPHVDLLPLSRRLWRRRLGSCALASLERQLLGVRREQEDVPGWLIPRLYHDYLRNGDGAEMVRVFYHNEVDMLSMVTLISRVLALLAGTSGDVAGEDLLSLGTWQSEIGLVEQAEQNLRRATSADLSLFHYKQALNHLGLLLKRDNRREEALTIWKQMAAISLDDVGAHVELAKHFEWQRKDIGSAINWTEQALDLVTRWGSTKEAELRHNELTHRLERLKRKQVDTTSLSSSE